MTYYAIIYLTNGEIHLKPYPTKGQAERCISNTVGHKVPADRVKLAKVISKDPQKPSWSEFWVH